LLTFGKIDDSVVQRYELLHYWMGSMKSRHRAVHLVVVVQETRLVNPNMTREHLGSRCVNEMDWNIKFLFDRGQCFYTWFCDSELASIDGFNHNGY